MVMRPYPKKANPIMGDQILMPGFYVLLAREVIDINTKGLT